MLREWLDSNLPSMIEKLVEKELEKLARQARND
jgi:cell pole-organizing protein PopZ